MSIRSKSLWLIGIGISFVLAIAITFASNIFLRRFDEIELDRAGTNLERVQQAFDVEKNNLSTKLSDWSTWDDAYRFAGDTNKEFIDSNLQDVTFENLNLYAMIVSRPGDRVVYAKAFDAEGEISSTISATIKNITLSPLFGTLKKQDQHITGVFVDSGIPFLLSARPILKSNSEGPSRGVLFFIRKLTRSYTSEFGRIVRLPVSILTIDPKNTTEHIKEELSEGRESLVEIESKNSLEVDHFETDIFGNPALYFHMELPRDIHEQGVSVVRYIGIAGGSLGILVIIGLVFILDKLVLHRIIKAGQQIDAVSRKGSVSLRVETDNQHDEISRLIASVNSMLQSLEYSQHLLADERYRMQQYIDSAGVMILAYSPDGEVILVNKKTCDILGIPKQDLIGKNWFSDILSDSVREFAKTSFSEVMSDNAKRGEYCEYTIQTKAGGQRLVAWYNSVLRNNEGNIVAAISSGEDITDRKATEIAIEQKNRELESTKSAMLNILEDERKLESQIKQERDQAQTIISSMNEGLFVVDKLYTVILANKTAAQITGLNISDMIGKKLSDITTVYKGNEKMTRENRPLYRTITSGESFSFGLEDNQFLEGKNGRIPIALATTPLKQGNEIIGGLVTFHDVSKDKAIKETIEHEVSQRTNDLVREQARFMSSIRNLSLGFIMTDDNGTVVLINAIARQLLNLTSEALTIADLSKAFEGSIDVIGEARICKETKSPKRFGSIQYLSRWIRMYMAPIITQDEKKDVIGQVFVLEDNTESKLVERSKDEFFSIASHELRTPLTAIRGNTSMIKDFYGDKITDPDLREMIDDIHASSIRLIDIVNDFLNVSRLEQGKIDFKKINFDMKDVIIQSVKEFEGSALEKKVTVRFEDSDELPLVYADPDRTKQALLNLIGNSLKFTEHGDVIVQAQKDGSVVRVTVKDTGRGIPKDNQSLLFRKFQQAGSSLFTRDTTKGTGLGLYISRLIIDGMGGKIWLEKSEEGVGSEFCFTLPIADKA